MKRLFPLLLFAGLLMPDIAAAAEAPFGLLSEAAESQDVSPVLRIFLVLTALSFLPALMVAMTSFTRNIIVLSLLRQALGLQQTPPNSVLLTLALFLTLFTMLPTLNAVRDVAYTPYVSGEISADTALEQGFEPVKAFMIRQTREQDLGLILEVSNAPVPERVEDVSAIHLIPAFMLSELKTAFQIGFVIFLPFLLIDLVVAAILMSLGMIMLPPIAISLPIKIMLFVLIDGWALIIQSLLSGYAT